MSKIVVPYVHIQCPNDACRSMNVRTIDTRGAIRIHVCNQCQTRFRSFDSSYDRTSQPGDTIRTTT